MRIGACLWSLPEDPHEAAAWAKDAGFEAIDVDPGFAAGWDAASGLPVASVAIAHLIPDGAALEAADDSARQQAFDHVRAGLAEAAELNAEFVYLPPAAASAIDPASRERFREAVVTLTEESARLGIKFGIEHFPGYALPSVAETLAFVEDVAHPNLYVLLDIGHAQISREGVPDAVAALGDLLTFVHFDDNRGELDDHLALLDGLQQEQDLVDAVRALRRHGYDGQISIEMNPKLPDPRDAMDRSFEILKRVMAQA